MIAAVDRSGELTVDARGLLCPLPVLRLAKALRGRAPGTTALLLATDPSATADVEAFCRERSCSLLETRREGSLLFFRVRQESPAHLAPYGTARGSRSTLQRTRSKRR